MNPPEISNTTQPNETILLETPVQINATVTDATSGVKQVFLNYTFTNTTGTWNNVLSMTQVDLNIWQTTIPAFPSNTNVTYSVTAEDYAGNSISTENFQYESGQPTVNEYTSIFLLFILLTATALTLTISKRRRPLHSAGSHAKAKKNNFKF
jgi:hypothetical protein